MIILRKIMVIVFKLWNVLLCQIYVQNTFKKIVTIKKTSWPLRAGFEPTRENPIGFQVQRLNLSAIAAVKSQWKQKY